MMKLRRCVQTVVQMAVTVVLAVLLVCNLYTLAAKKLMGVQHPTVFGFSTAVVVSGSMEPALSVNDLIVIHAQANYAPGDIISFASGRTLVTHRIVQTNADGFVTQGDANNTADIQPVLPEQIAGKVIFSVPAVGIVLEYLQTPLGLTCLVLLGLLLIELPYFIAKWNHSAAQKEEENNGT